MSWLHLVHVCVLCGTVVTQTDSNDAAYDVSMWQRAPDPFATPDQGTIFLPGGEVVPGGIFDVPETPTERIDCMCVQFYQCDKDNWIKSTGEGLVNPRLGDAATEWNVERCRDTTMQCCKVPPGAPAAPPPLLQPTPEIVPNVPKCGLKKDSAVDGLLLRIKSGEDADFGEFPWMLALLNELTMPDGGLVNIFACGASLIHPQVALTAAHCITTARKRYPGVQFKVSAGEWDTNTTEELFPHQDRDVQKVIMHEGFNKASLVNDIALLVLSQPLELADNVGTVCLPDPNEQFLGSNCVATGWGRGSFDAIEPYETILHKVELQITPKHECQDELRKTKLGPNFRLNPSFLCAKGQGGRDSCKGDGGGPLVCPSAHNSNHFVQVGVISWGIGCGSETPSIYTDLSRLRIWIDEMMAIEDLAAESGPNTATLYN